MSHANLLLAMEGFIDRSLKEANEETIARHYEVCFKQTRWGNSKMKQCCRQPLNSLSPRVEKQAFKEHGGRRWKAISFLVHLLWNHFPAWANTVIVERLKVVFFNKSFHYDHHTVGLGRRGRSVSPVDGIVALCRWHLGLSVTSRP